MLRSIRFQASGFPSPADDFLDLSLDLNQHLVKHPAATFYMQVVGNRNCSIGINDGDLLVVDRSLLPRRSKLVVAIIDGELRLVKLGLQHSKMELWGVVTYIIRGI